MGNMIFSKEKFKEIFLYVLSKVGSQPNVGETVLYKLLYFIDFDFYEKYEEYLTGLTYIKNRYGPTPKEFPKIIKEMLNKQEISFIETKYHNLSQKKYIALRSPDLRKLQGHELDLINNVMERLSSMNATQISEHSHGDIPWLTTNDESVIDYEKVFYRTPSYSVREYSDQV